MTENECKQDTLFIDMKYIVLYRKLGFREVKKDVFISHYDGTEIIIEAESQRFLFNNQWHQLLTYKDMVKLECIDRLLKKGYGAEKLVFDERYDATLLDIDGSAFVGFVFDEWGMKYERLLDNYEYDGKETVFLYTSQLSGGLIEYKYKIYTQEGTFENGFFETNFELYPKRYNNVDSNDIFNDGNFIIVGNELIKYIGDRAEVVIPNGIVKIGTGAFWNNTAVEEIHIPDTVTVIKGDAFIYCDNLKRIIIPRNVDTIGDNPFAGCPDLIIENLSAAFVLEEGVLFDRKKNLIHYTPSKEESEYIIPESVEWIGKHSFYKCENLKCVTITKNVAYMGNNAFSDCSNITLINHSPYFYYEGGLLYNGDITQVYHYSLGSGVKNVIIKNGVRTIGRNSFWNARKIETIAIPETVRQIGYNPFANCINAIFIVHSPAYTMFNGVLYTSDLKEVVCCTSRAVENGTVLLHDQTDSIARNAFTGCEALRNIRLPPKLKTIGRGAFSGCINLTGIEIPNSVEQLGDWAFNNCEAMKIIRIPEGLKIKQNTFKNCPGKEIFY